jgi:hypothetical protein
MLERDETAINYRIWARIRTLVKATVFDLMTSRPPQSQLQAKSKNRHDKFNGVEVDTSRLMAGIHLLSYFDIIRPQRLNCRLINEELLIRCLLEFAVAPTLKAIIETTVSKKRCDVQII